MKILIFLLVLTIETSAQFRVIGDTTYLKNTYGSGIVLLEQYGKGDVTGGGLFHRIDSTYKEGTNAFAYPVDGFQWARLGLIDYFLEVSSANYKVPVWVTDQYVPYDLAGIDSFYTTSVKDTIEILGVDTNDIFVFSEWTPNYSATADTMIFHYQCKEDTVFVFRDSPGVVPEYKTGGQYSYMRLK